MVMRRGFFSSGTMRSRSTWSRPFSSCARLDLDMLGKLEAALEGAARDALIEQSRGFLGLVLALAAAR